MRLNRSLMQEVRDRGVVCTKTYYIFNVSKTKGTKADSLYAPCAPSKGEPDGKNARCSNEM